LASHEFDGKYETINVFGNDYITYHDNPIFIPLLVPDCEQSLSLFGVDVINTGKNDMSGTSGNIEMSENSTFIGVELSGFIGIGGGIKIGFNF